MIKKTVVAALLATAALGATACGGATQDAEKSGQRVDTAAANVIAFPDKFRNVAHKCDGAGHRVYSNSTGDSGSSAELFVINDPTCGPK
jgi:citrate synthase